MTSKITRVLLLLAFASPVIAAEPYEPWPSKDQLRSIEQAAYACSRDNSTEACSAGPSARRSFDGSLQVAGALQRRAVVPDG